MGGWARARPVRGMGYIRGRESYRVEVGGGLVNGILLGHPFTRTPRKLEDLIWRAVWMLCSPRQCRLLNRCLYMYVFTHVRKYTHTYTHIHMCVYIYTYTYTCALTYTCTRACCTHPPMRYTNTSSYFRVGLPLSCVYTYEISINARSPLP